MAVPQSFESWSACWLRYKLTSSKQKRRWCTKLNIYRSIFRLASVLSKKSKRSEQSIVQSHNASVVLEASVIFHSMYQFCKYHLESMSDTIVSFEQISNSTFKMIPKDIFIRCYRSTEATPENKSVWVAWKSAADMWSFIVFFFFPALKNL